MGVGRRRLGGSGLTARGVPALLLLQEPQLPATQLPTEEIELGREAESAKRKGRGGERNKERDW